ncbi:MAG: DnaB-like helicase C-terminal domain-containing protein [Gemmatimonadales bacterium]
MRVPPRKRAPSAPTPPLESLVDRMDASVSGAPWSDTVPTGFPSLDQILGGGLRKQDLVILAGDVGSGKSALGLAIAIRSALKGTPTVYLSGEMTEERLMERALALEGRASVDDIRRGDLDDLTRASVGAAAVRLRGLPLQVRPLVGSSFAEVEQVLDTVPRRALVVVDYLQMVAPPQDVATVDERAAAAARALKGLALEREVAVLALAQLPKLAPKRRDPRPSLDDLGGLGAVKQHADVVLAIYREEMYQPGGGMEGATELIVAKNRNGPTGFVDLYFYRAWMRFEDMLDPER